jgi:hypothetical protein
MTYLRSTAQASSHGLAPQRKVAAVGLLNLVPGLKQQIPLLPFKTSLHKDIDMQGNFNENFNKSKTYWRHSWALASRKLTPASITQSGTGPKKCRTALACSGTGPVPASLLFLFRNRTDLMPDSPAFQHLNTRTRKRTHTRTRTHTYDVQHEHGQKHGRSAWT